MRKQSFKSMKAWRKVVFVLVRLIALALICFAIIIIYLHFTEYKPDKEISLEVSSGSKEDGLELDKEFTALSWNTGYGALGEDGDFFMDGGKMVNTANLEEVKENVSEIGKNIEKINPDFALLQEVDLNSKRSNRLDERKFLEESIKKWNYDSTFAYNYKVKFIPYPLPPMGEVNSGILTLSDSKIESAERIQLPCPFSWPVRLANLKRCLSINRIPIKNSDKQLVLINLHLEAYDDGEGKIAQTRMLNEYLSKEYEKGNYVLAGGDFNQTFSKTDISNLKQFEKTWKPSVVNQDEFSDSWQFLMDSSTPTCRSLDKPLDSLDTNEFQFYVIDGFIASSNIEVINFETKDFEFKNTDHNPIVLKFSLKK